MLSTIFKKIAPLSKLSNSRKTVEDQVKEIHDAFNSEVDRILAECNITLSNDEDLSKGNRLNRLGFVNTDEANRARELASEKHRANELRKLIQCFAIKYPQYKLITPESVQKLCDKYDLHCGVVHQYIGSVPDKNLADIERFKIDEDDILYLEFYSTFGSRNIENLSDLIGRSINYANKSTYDRWLSDMQRFRLGRVVYKCPMFICAPKQDFKLPEKSKIPDPIVLQPVVFDRKCLFLIVTAWGAEASDPDVVNDKMN